MKIGNKPFALAMASVLLVTVVATNLQHVYAQIDPGNFVVWKKTTHEFEKGVIAAIDDPENIPDALNAYSLDVLQIFSGDPNIDQVRTLLQSYERDVTTIFDQTPPMPDKHAQLDQIKDFRAITHDYEKAVIGLTQPPEPE
jgi:hypothetical protein